MYIYIYIYTYVLNEASSATVGEASSTKVTFSECEGLRCEKVVMPCDTFAEMNIRPYASASPNFICYGRQLHYCATYDNCVVLVLLHGCLIATIQVICDRIASHLPSTNSKVLGNCRPSLLGFSRTVNIDLPETETFWFPTGISRLFAGLFLDSYATHFPP